MGRWLCGWVGGGVSVSYGGLVRLWLVGLLCGWVECFITIDGQTLFVMCIFFFLCPIGNVWILVKGGREYVLDG